MEAGIGDPQGRVGAIGIDGGMMLAGRGAAPTGGQLVSLCFYKYGGWDRRPAKAGRRNWH